MTLVIGILIGWFTAYLYSRFMARVVRSLLGAKKSSLRTDILDKMGYGALVEFRDSANAEIERRRGEKS